MTIQAAMILDDAFEVFKTIARQADPSPISRQSPSWETSKTPYDFAAELCKSLPNYKIKVIPPKNKTNPTDPQPKTQVKPKPQDPKPNTGSKTPKNL